MLDACTTLTAAQLAAIDDLARRTVAVDGGRIKLEPDALARESWDRALWWHGDRLVGFLGAYTFGADAELAGMVGPDARRRGIGRALLAQVGSALGARGVGSALLVAPRATDSGRAFAAAVGGVLSHSEHALVLDGPPRVGEPDGATAIRAARADDLAAVVPMLQDAFGYGDATLFDRRGHENLVVERDGAVVGYLRASLTHGEGGVHGFVIDPAQRGRGIGRDVLGRVCHRLRTEGASRVGLEVAVHNEHALGLYISLGFTPVTTEDYFRVSLPTS